MTDAVKSDTKQCLASALLEQIKISCYTEYKVLGPSLIYNNLLEKYHSVKPVQNELNYFYAKLNSSFPGFATNDNILSFLKLMTSKNPDNDIEAGVVLDPCNSVGDAMLGRSPGVNFTKMLCAAFLYKSALHSFSLLTFWLCYSFAKEYWCKICL